MRLVEGEIVERFELLAPLGRGGQASVWRARRLEDGGLVALKLVKLRGGAGDERARREARALSRTQHPSLPRCTAFFESDALGLIGLELELVEGPDLYTLKSSPAMHRRARTLALRHVASALAHLHGLGVVHRDVKLSNIVAAHDFLEAPEDPHRCKLLDLGIAALIGNPEPLTQLGHPGTVPYLAPEALDPIRFPVPAARPTLDVYAFGVAGWLLLNGEHPTGLPLDAPDEELAELYAQRADAHDEVVPLSDRMEPVMHVLARCLQLHAEARFLTGAELLAELDRALAAATRLVEPRIVIRTDPPPPQTLPPTLRNPRTVHPAMWFVMGAASVAAAFGLYSLVDADEEVAELANARIGEGTPTSSSAKESAVTIEGEDASSGTSEASDAPSAAEWDDMEHEAYIERSSALGCETKVVRSWFRARCKAPLGTLAISWPDREPEGARVDEGLLETTVLVPLDGQAVRIDFDWRGGKGQWTLWLVGVAVPRLVPQGRFERGGE